MLEDEIKFYDSLLSLLRDLDFVEHKKRIEKIIEWNQKQIQDEIKANLLRQVSYKRESHFPKVDINSVK